MQAETTQSSSDSFHGLPFSVQTDDGQTSYDVSLFNTTIGNINALWHICRKYKVVLPDSMREDFNAFVNVVMSPNTVILGVGDVGVVYVTDLIPGDSGLCHYLFWDRDLRNKSKLVLACMKWGFDTFDLARVTVILPRHASAALHHVYKMGLRIEGVMRESMLIGGKRADCFVFGVLRRELTDEVLFNGYMQRDEDQSNWYQALSNDPVLMRKIMQRGSRK